MKKKINAENIFFPIILLFYCIAFIWSYVFYLVPSWSYLGLSYEERGFLHIFQAIIFCLLPYFWIPKSIIRPSMIIYFILYVMTYIPMIVGVNLAKNFSITQIYIFNFVSLISFYLNGVFYKIPLLYLRKPHFENRLYWSIVFLSTIGLMLYTLYIFRNHLTFIGIFSDSLYDVRFVGA
jgi:hypothetical protein